MKYGEKSFHQKVTVCNCMSEAHQFTFMFDPTTPDNEYQECYLDVHLSNPCSDHHKPFGKFICKDFWKRIWHGIRYIFGYKSRYGAWDSVIVSRDDAKELRDLFDRYFKFCEQKDERQNEVDEKPLAPSRL